VVVYEEDDNNELLIERVINENRVEVVKLTPSHLKAIRDKKIELIHSSIKKLIVGGEELETGLAVDILKIFNRDIDIFNEYGPTETVVGTMIYQFNPETDTDYSVPIGVPISNTRIYILDRKQRPVPFGVLGELCVSGDNIARGYLGRVELTAEKFMENPYVKGKKLYRTGDLARFLPDGNIHFAGRIDTQVKIRGFRIELGEIRSLLFNRNEIKDAVVLDREDKSGNTAICAYLVYRPGGELSVPQLRDYLTEHLPGYMIPGYFVKVEKIPLTPNGKVDRKRLPPPEIKPGENYAEPGTHYEKIITQIWMEVLGLEKVGVNDNFFDLGGNSLLSIRIVGRFKEVFKRDIPIVTMYRYLTIRSFARFLEQDDSIESFAQRDRSGEISEGKNRLKQTMRLMRKNEGK
jgi:acyl-coenzyme A synthetase/AMP-(fatty) acid ligase